MLSDNVPSSKVPSGVDSVQIDHASDWSGNAYIVWAVNGTAHEVQLPGKVLRAALGKKPHVRGIARPRRRGGR